MQLLIFLLSHIVCQFFKEMSFISIVFIKEIELTKLQIYLNAYWKLTLIMFILNYFSRFVTMEEKGLVPVRL